MDDFGRVEDTWNARQPTLRMAVRHELIARQLARHVPTGATVLDVGCGEGGQAIRLAARGCAVTGVDPSPAQLERLRAAAAAAGVEVAAVRGSLEDASDRVGGRRYDVVCAHGLLMYLPDRAAALRALADRLTDGGLLSITFRNADALALRPALRGEWEAARRAFGADRYVNDLGAPARADRLDDVRADLHQAGLAVSAWYGVRLFTDALPADAPPPDDLAAIVDVEEQAGSREPYRRLASQLHVLAVSAGSGPEDRR